MAQSVLQTRLSHFFSLISDIRHSDVFDASWYRRQSLGARVSLDPVVHYLFWGWKQGLNPSPAFDTRFYIERYRDVRESRANPLKHYMIHGRDEGRLATRSGRIFRDTLFPEYSPLPLFGAPAGDTRRLTVVIDDHTPKLLGVGFMPLLGLACHSAKAAGWTLRILIRSHTITTSEVSSALNAVASGERPVVDISRREPGPTDDVDSSDQEVWWASSASSLESLRHFVPHSSLWWVMGADEVSRASSGEHREVATRLLGERSLRIIALGDQVASVLPKTRVSYTVSVLPQLVGHSPVKKPGKTLGVVLCPDQAESLASTSTEVIEYTLTHQLLDPKVWKLKLIGLDWEPLTLSGSVVVEQTAPAASEEWSLALASVDALVVVQAGTEHPWLARQASVPVVSGKGDVGALGKALGKALSEKAAKPELAANWATVVSPIVSAMESARG